MNRHLRIYRNVDVHKIPLDFNERMSVLFVHDRNRNAKSTKLEMAEDLEKKLLTEMECPVCDNIMFPPICQCQNGHSICNECFQKVKNCPSCRAPKNPVARSYALEAIHAKLRVPCKNAFSGCEYVCLGSEIVKHQVYCRYSKKVCPFTSYDNCTWSDVDSRLKSHLSKKHSSNFYIKDKQRFMSQNFKKIDSYHYIYAVVYAYREFFRLTWDLDGVTGMTRWAVYFLGSPEEAKKYSYKLEFPMPDEDRSNATASLVFRSPCSSAPEKDSIKFNEHKCFYVHRNLLNEYCESSGHLNYRITVYCNIKEEYETINGLLEELSTED